MPVSNDYTVSPDGVCHAAWWSHEQESNRIKCVLCPRECMLKPGDRGFCFVRQNVDDDLVLTTYGRSTGFCIDPIEKKPLNHFYPGTSVLSFGTAGCNLGCQFCQNWDISKSREVERLSDVASPDGIAEAALKFDCKSVAFTYNDPVVWAEYAIDAAKACHENGIKTVAVTAGYISDVARSAFFSNIDAANVDLKAFSEDFYRKITYSHLQPVLRTLLYLRHETDVWFEITNLVVPNANDDEYEFERMCDWIYHELGPNVPIHFTAFHPDFRMRDRPPTDPSILKKAAKIARRSGIRFVYVGNVEDPVNQNTYCPNCRECLVERDWYDLGVYRLKHNRCGSCKQEIPGCFAERPGNWGRKRLPIDMRPFAH